MIALPWLLLLAAGPCSQDTASWKTIRHGAEEIRSSANGSTLLLAARNLGKLPAQIDIVFKELGFSGTARVFDLTAGIDLGKVQGGFAAKLAPGACAAYRLQSTSPSR